MTETNILALLRSRSKRPQQMYKRIRLTRISQMPIHILEERIEEMAEHEEALSRYEHGQEVG